MASLIPSSSFPSPSSDESLAGPLPSKIGKPQFKIEVLDRSNLEEKRLQQIATEITNIVKNVGFIIQSQEVEMRVTEGSDMWGQERQYVLAQKVDSANDVCGYLEYYDKEDAPYVAFIGVMNAYDKENKIAGVGTALMMEFVKNAQKSGKEQITLECRETKGGKNYGLPEFYERIAEKVDCGFEKKISGKYRSGDPKLEIVYFLKQGYRKP